MNRGAAEGAGGRKIGILAVHGIGAQARGDLARSLARGLGRALEGTITPGDGGPSARAPSRVVHGDAPPNDEDPVVIHHGDTQILIYDVYWAERLMGPPVHGTLSWHALTSLAWFPRLNLRHGLYLEGGPRVGEVMLWTPVLMVFGVMLGISQGTLGLFRSLWGAHSNAEGPDLTGAPAGGLSRALYSVRAHADHGVEVGNRPSPLDHLLDEYIGDVTNYVASASGRGSGKAGVGGTDGVEAESPPEAIRAAYPAILRTFYETAGRAHRDCDDVQVVAHSLGTVVSFHALAGYRARECGIEIEHHREAINGISRLYTIGSPLAKIRFLWPRLIPRTNLLRTTPLVWDNFVSRLDPVAGRLRGRYGPWGEVVDHMTLGGGVVRAHTLYDRNRRFLGLLTEGLIGEPKVPRTGWSERLKAGGLLLMETLGAPLVLLGVLVLGAVALFGLPLLIAWGAGQLVGVFDGGAGDAVQSWTAILMIGGFLLAFAVNSPRHAAERHKVWRDPPAAAPPGRTPEDPGEP